jgi:tRNA-specific 2-thiouridylase
MKGNRIEVVFKYPQRAITKGQAVVFYTKDILIGGGIIE